ncbi:DUF4038 domain-containing protein [Aquiflexum sp.]|uniref:apiosidase-like domain-containing protein n=1 Tax=Aquiflexum sp. TaxID=1872584 RepID=UPI003593309D
MIRNILYVFIFLFGGLLFGCQQSDTLTEVEQWTTYEITLKSEVQLGNPYMDVDVYATFISSSGDTLVRPGFWYEDNTWKIRFAPPAANETYRWETFTNNPSPGLSGKKGQITSIQYSGNNQLLKKGFLTMSPGKRNVVHQDGSPFLMIGDTPWALPFRGTVETVNQYAEDRRSKGYNTALLMSIQPDRLAEGPDSRLEDYGFGKAFYDLKDKHITQMNPAYFQTLDTLVGILFEHEIVPVFQPVFQGFGWKGQDAFGRSTVPEEYIRYTKYVLARYGSIPAMYLVSADGMGKEPGIKESGEMLAQWDCYEQPRGIHYSPADDYVPDWHQGNTEDYFKHRNMSYQAEPWLNFQWCQTGHGGQHLLEKVEKMYHNKPTKAVANGEPTYERIGDPNNSTGWWQGDEAWSQIMSGGTMGVVYGAAGVWNWKLRTEEPGFPDWSTTNASAVEAIKFEGSKYPGLLGKAFKGYDIVDMELGEELSNGHKMLFKQDKFYASYLPEGGEITIRNLKKGLPIRFYDPKVGTFTESGKVEAEEQSFVAPDNGPWVIMIGEKIGN